MWSGVFFKKNLVFTNRCEGEYGKEEWARGGVEECKRDVKNILEELGEGLGKKVKGVSKKILEKEWEREYGEEGRGMREEGMKGMSKKILYIRGMGEWIRRWVEGGGGGEKK